MKSIIARVDRGRIGLLLKTLERIVTRNMNVWWPYDPHERTQSLASRDDSFVRTGEIYLAITVEDDAVDRVIGAISSQDESGSGLCDSVTILPDYGCTLRCAVVAGFYSVN